MMIVDTLCRLQAILGLKAAKSHRRHARAKGWLPEEGGSAGMAEVKRDGLAAVADPGKHGRGAGAFDHFACEEHWDPESGACPALAFQAMTNGDFSGFSLCDDRKRAAGTGTFRFIRAFSQVQSDLMPNRR